jgi:hypothetical protein
MRARAIIAVVLLLALARVSASELVLMQNLDGDLSFVGATPDGSKEKLQTLVDSIAGGPAKSLMWSIGAGSDILYYQTKVASTWGWRHTKYHDDPKWKERIRRCQVATEAGLDAPRIVGERARERGLKFFPSYRMNDAHYCSDPLHYPLTGKFWMDHQDASIGASPVAGWDGYKHLLNYAREDVRAYRLGVILEALDRYADLMDGFELDFNRFQIFFPPGTASQNAHLMTSVVEQVRQRLDAISAAQKRPMKLIVRVPPAMKNCTWAGLDVSTWMKRRLIDAIIPAQVMTLSHDMPLAEFVELAQASGCEVIGSLYGRAGYTWPFSADHSIESYSKEVSRTPAAPQFLGAALNQRHLGVSGHQIYNYILHTDSATVKALTTLQGPRRYQITQAYFHDREDSYEYRKQMPAPLENGKAMALRVLVGEDPSKGTAFLRLGLHGANQAYGNYSMKAVINGRPLHSGDITPHLVVTKGLRHGIAPCPATEAYVQWPITDGAMLHEGWNAIAVTLESAAASKLLQLVETEIAIVPSP